MNSISVCMNNGVSSQIHMLLWKNVLNSQNLSLLITKYFGALRTMFLIENLFLATYMFIYIYI